MAAAQAAAEVALCEATARESEKSPSVGSGCPDTTDRSFCSLIHGSNEMVSVDNVSTASESDSTTHQDNSILPGDFMDSQLDGDGSMESLLQMVTQHEQHQRFAAAAEATQAALYARPYLHYLTVAQNGEY